MPKCAYCGRENGDAENFCSACGTSLKEPPTPIPLRTPHRMMGEIQQFIWEYFAVKRRRFYLAGLFIGMFGGVLAAMHDPLSAAEWQFGRARHAHPCSPAAVAERQERVKKLCGAAPAAPTPFFSCGNGEVINCRDNDQRAFNGCSACSH